MTLSELESLLDSGKLEILMTSGRYWKIRRNGKTKLWKTRPNDFRIPIKFGFKLCGAIDHSDLAKFDDFFRIKN